jgi:N-acetylglucosamine transport system substrate-binding protein
MINKHTGKIKFIIVIILISLSVSILSGCKPSDSNQSSKGNLSVTMLEAGFGVKFMQQLLDDFKSVNEGFTYTFKYAPVNSDKIRSELTLGAAKNDVDLYFTEQAINLPDLIENGKTVDGQGNIIEELTPLLKEKVYGENVTLGDKLRDDFKPYTEIAYGPQKGKYYSLPWAANNVGLFYNAKMFEEKGWNVPLTTNELTTLTQKIYSLIDFKKPQNQRVYPFIFAGMNAVGYWSYLFDHWWAQYDGIESHRNFFAVNYPGGVDKAYELYKADGMREMLVALAPIIAKKYSYPGSRSFDHTSAQMFFLGGRAAMMANGDWIENEMRSNFNPGELDIRLMKTPIVSSIAKKYTLAGANASDADNESKLIQLIKLIDEKKSDSEIVSLTNVSEDKVKKIKEAREVQLNLGPGFQAVIPSYSEQKDLAKKFLLYFASDRAQTIYRNAVGLPLPYKYNGKPVANETIFAKTTRETFERTNIIFETSLMHPIRYKGGMSVFNKHIGFLIELSDGADPVAIWNDEYEFAKLKWPDAMQTAGLK